MSGTTTIAQRIALGGITAVVGTAAGAGSSWIMHAQPRRTADPYGVHSATPASVALGLGSGTAILGGAALGLYTLGSEVRSPFLLAAGLVLAAAGIGGVIGGTVALSS
ncbi:MAG: hypothetical protein H7287_05235 [Thermoleophilia bacterium]|nr:hypothetical protein [Thermoleophilia bacterium]